MVGHNDKGFWVPSHCSMVDTAPKSLMEKIGGKRLALIGDSHTRNLFEGFLCEIRDATLCPDAKSANNIYYYHFNETHDDLSLILKKEMIYEVKSKHFETIVQSDIVKNLRFEQPSTFEKYSFE